MTSRGFIEAKIVMLGGTNVGKTSMAVRYCLNSFYEQTSPTVGGSFLSKSITIKDRRVKLQIWDTAGQERFRSLAPMYYRGASAAIVVFDITSQQSYNTVKDWIAELKRNLQKEIHVAIVGNKCDLEADRVVPRTKARDYAECIGALYFETSAKTDEGIHEMFLAVSKELLNDPSVTRPPVVQTPSLRASIEDTTQLNNGANRDGCYC